MKPWREIAVFTHGVTCYLKRLCCNSVSFSFPYSLKRGNTSILGFYDILLISIAKCICTVKYIKIYILNGIQDICDVNIYKHSFIRIKRCGDYLEFSTIEFNKKKKREKE